jgi:hypothetical protein
LQNDKKPGKASHGVELIWIKIYSKSYAAAIPRKGTVGSASVIVALPQQHFQEMRQRASKISRKRSIWTRNGLEEQTGREENRNFQRVFASGKAHLAYPWLLCRGRETRAAAELPIKCT